MNEVEIRIRFEGKTKAVKLTLHAHQEMVGAGITVNELRTSLETSVLLEDYPDHKRGPCCLVCGQASTGRFVHVVCTTGVTELIIMTTYEPKPPKWETPFKRGRAS